MAFQFVLLLVAYIYPFQRERARPRSDQVRTGELVVSLCVATASASWKLRGGVSPDSGTLILPVYTTIIGMAGYALALSIRLLAAAVPGLRVLSGMGAPVRSKVAGAAFAVLVALIGTQAYYAKHALRSEAEFPETRQDRLDTLMIGSLGSGDLDMVAALVENRNVPAYSMDAAYRYSHGVAAAGDVHPCRNIYVALARNWRTPPHILTALADNPSEAVRVRLAANRRTPMAVLRKLAVDPVFVVRKAVTGNSRLPIGDLRLLAANRNPHVQSRALAVLQARTGIAGS